jgi:hypothetical protein
MGLMRLVVHDRDRIPPDGLEHVHISGLDELPYFGRTYFSGRQLVIERNESDSGRVQVPWRIGGGGPLLLSTATLMERPAPYLLEVELARGTVNDLRNQLAAWEMAGLATPQPVRDKVRKSTIEFARAATMQDDPAAAADHAGRCLATAIEATDALAAEFVTQAMRGREALRRQPNTWFGVRLGTGAPPPEIARRLPAAFNMACVPFTWRQVEAVEGRRQWDEADAQIAWARSAGLKVSSGPLLELDDRGLPDWTYLWEGDVSSLLGFMTDHVRAVVQRYRSKVHLWQVASRVTRGRALGLDEESRLPITARAIATVRELDPTTPVIVTFDQPWADYLANEHLDLAPIHFADALVRGDLGLSGIGLELNIGYHPGASIHRSPLEFSRLLDTWSLLELPLFITLTVPSSDVSDPHATSAVRAVGGIEGSVTPQTQADWIERHVPLLLAKPQVQVLVWNQLTDADPHHYPHSGLFDAEGEAKPALEALTKIRQKYFGKAS